MPARLLLMPEGGTCWEVTDQLDPPSVVDAIAE
jgi:hypothetical protein